MSTGRGRGVLVAIATAVVVSSLVAPTSSAWAASPRVTLRLVAQPAWSRPGDRLNIKIRVINGGSAPLRGFYLRVIAHPRVNSRSDLHASFNGSPTIFSALPSYSNKTIAPGRSQTVLLDQPVSRLFDAVQEGQGGVYPVTVAVLSTGTFQTLTSLETDVMYYPSRPLTPLKMVLVVPISGVPALGPGGVLRPDPTTHQITLEQFLQPSGWLPGLVAALQTRATKDLRLAMAPTPRLLEEVKAMTDGYRRAQGDKIVDVGKSSAQARDANRFLNSLGSLLATRRIQPLLTPYDVPDLPALAEHLLGPDIGHQIGAAERVLRRLPASPAFGESWIYPPAGRLDGSALEQLRILPTVGRHAFFSSDSLRPAPTSRLAGCPQGPTTFACPVKVQSEAGTTTGFVSDSDLQRRLGALAREPDKPLLLQRVLAETATIHAELPFTRGRIIEATLPSLWHPSPRTSSLLFRSFAQAPWLQLVTPREGLRQAISPRLRQVVDRARRAPKQPGRRYYDEIRSAITALDHYKSMDPPAARLQRLRRNLFVSESRAWWVDSSHLVRGESYALQTAGEARGEMRKIGLIAPGGVTLSSRRGPIPLVLRNDTGYPVRVKVDVRSEKLVPFAHERSFLMTLTKVTTPTTLPGVAQASGTFPLTVTVTTPDGRFIIASARIEIRSTKFNEIALGMTIGAFAFLVSFYVLRVLRRRRAGSDEPGQRAPVA